MKNIDVVFSVDVELKKQADILFADLGMNFSTAINVFLHQAIREQNIPFTVTRNVPDSVQPATVDAVSIEKDEAKQRRLENINEILDLLNEI